MASRPGSSVGTSVRLKSGRSPVRPRPWPPFLHGHLPRPAVEWSSSRVRRPTIPLWSETTPDHRAPKNPEHNVSSGPGQSPCGQAGGALAEAGRAPTPIPTLRPPIRPHPTHRSRQCPLRSHGQVGAPPQNGDWPQSGRVAVFGVVTDLRREDRAEARRCTQPRLHRSAPGPRACG